MRNDNQSKLRGGGGGGGVSRHSANCRVCNLVPRAMPVRGLGLALALGKRKEIRNFIGCREINNLGAA